jgi:hypothetical protein
MTDTTDDTIDTCRGSGRRRLRGHRPEGLDAVPHQDCAFLSPTVFTRRQGD